MSRDNRSSRLIKLMTEGAKIPKMVEVPTLGSKKGAPIPPLQQVPPKVNGTQGKSKTSNGK